MRLKFAALLAGAFMFLTVPAFAGSIDFCAGQATDTNLGASLSANGITATGWSANGVSADLYCKADGPTETGLGLVGTAENEIGPGQFVQMDLSNFSGTSLTFTIESLQAGEGFTFFASDTNGVLGSSFVTSGVGTGANQVVTVTVPDATYLDITGSGSGSENVLLGAGPTPEPGSYLLMGTGLLMLGFFMRRRFASASR